MGIGATRRTSRGERSTTLKSLLEFSSREGTVRGWNFAVIAFFLFVVLLPPLFILSFTVTGREDLQAYVFADPAVLAQVGSAVALSFGVALAVTAIDLVFGLPLAWFIVRRRFRGKAFLNTLIDAPLAVPTAGLGFSVALFWAANPAVSPPPLSPNFTNTPFLLLILLSFTTTFPYMVRSLAAILEQIETEYETAARTCGAAPMTAARTVTLPLFRAGIATGSILCLAKALSDTGGVQAALQIGRLFSISRASCSYSGTPNATVLIGAWRVIETACPTLATPLNAAIAFVSMVMVVLSIPLLFIVKYVAAHAKFPLRRVWPGAERRLSRGAAPRVRDGLAFGFLAFIVLVPSFFLVSFLAAGAPSGTADWGTFASSLALSFLIAGLATLIDLAFGVPLALYIVRGPRRRLGTLLDSFVNVPYIVPSAALGFSLFLFWGPLVNTGTMPILVVLVLAHVAFTFPFIVRSAVGALEEIDPGLDETARTLGARPVQAFRRVTFPVIKPAILAGAIMAFTRSVGETGATLSVAPGVLTVPIFIVGLLNPATADYYLAALAVVALTAISAAAIFGMRYVTRRAR